MFLLKMKVWIYFSEIVGSNWAPSEMWQIWRYDIRIMVSPEGGLALSKCNDVVWPVGCLQDSQGHNVRSSLEQAHGNLAKKIPLVWTKIGYIACNTPEVCPWQWLASRWRRRWCLPREGHTGTRRTPPPRDREQGEDQTRRWNIFIVNLLGFIPIFHLEQSILSNEKK